MAYWAPIEIEQIIVYGGWLYNYDNEVLWGSKYIFIAYVFGIVFLLSATLAIDHCELFGIKQGLSYDIYKKLKVSEEGKLSKRWHYNYIRHPIKFGFFWILLTPPWMTFNHLFFSFVCIVYILISVHFIEDPKLIDKFGDDYKNYIENTWTYFPLSCKTKTDVT